MIITPKASQSICGVNDYAFNVAEQLFKHSAYSKIIFGTERPLGLKTSTPFEFKHWRITTTKINQDTDVLINYTPLGFAKYGYPISFICFLRRLKKTSPNVRIFVLFHEIWNGSQKLKIHQKLIDQLAKKACLEIADLASGISAVTPGQKEKLEKERHCINISVQSVGANIFPPTHIDVLKTNRKPGSWIIFGLSHTRLWTLQANIKLIKELIRRGHITEIRAIGPTGDRYGKEEITYARLKLGDGFYTQLGVLSNSNISTELLSAEGAFISQTNDSIVKSGTFLSMVAHGVPIVCDIRQAIVELPSDSFFDRAELLNNYKIIKIEAKARTEKMLNWYHKKRSWQVIGSSILSWMSN